MPGLRIYLAIPVFLVGLGPVAAAEIPSPPRPKEYQVQLRYRIRAGRVQHIEQFLEMERHLKSLGFKKDAEPEAEPDDLSATRMAGTIPSENAGKILKDSHIKSILLMPAGYQKPANAEDPVKVQLTLESNIPQDRQRLLAEQTLGRLSLLGFKEAIGYDHRGFTRLVGTIPAGELDNLLKDLRTQPAGWLVPAQPIAQLPEPLRSFSPILVAEVIPEPDGFPLGNEVPPPLKDQAHLQKITPELRLLAENQDEAEKARRLEVILDRVPTGDARAWLRGLQAAAPGLQFEGRVGPVLTVIAQPKQAADLAALPFVHTIRLPRSGQPRLQPAPAGNIDHKLALQQTGLARVHALGPKGQGVKVVLIDGDFRGYEALVGKQLPAGTKLLDFTRERNPDLQPEPHGDGQVLGHGTQCALAIALAAPACDLILVRIDPAALYHLDAVIKATQGDVFQTERLVRGSLQLGEEKARLQKLKEDLLIEREAVLRNFGQDDESRKRREDHFARWKNFLAEEEALIVRGLRYTQLLQGLRDLKGAPIVISSLQWNEGYPVDGTSPLSRFIDDRPVQGLLWFQAAGRTRGQAWGGLFRDTDGNRVMEFAPPETPLPKGQWTRELNFLGWQPFAGDQAADLPANARIRLTIQWREPHDPSLEGRGEDFYQQPLANLKMLLLRQRDPSGSKVAADDLELLVRGNGLPQRINNTGRYTTYEQTIEFAAAAAGRYALRIEGSIPDLMRPSSVQSVPAQKVSWELRLRVFADVVDAPSQALGRPVFAGFPTDEGTLAMPADANRLIVVGALGDDGIWLPDSARGPALGLHLFEAKDVLKKDACFCGPGLGFDPVVKPTIWSPGRLKFVADGSPAAPDTSLAAAFAAGLAATVQSGDGPREYFLKILEVKPGGNLRIPEWWPNHSGKEK